MSTAVYRSSASLAVPLSQTTAPVFEYNCLFTHDVKRKNQKRWQDGTLRYHTFNRRIIVFDIPGNKVGDSHWTGSADLQEGDEVMLEKWGVMVEVSECTRKSDTDLTELFGVQKKAPLMAPRSTPMRQSGVRAVSSATPAFKHRPLNALLGGSRTPLGRAGLPAQSPFELRNNGIEDHTWEVGRSSKRLRTEDVAHRNPIRPANVSKLAAAAAKSPVACQIDHRVRQVGGASVTPIAGRLSTREVVDLCDESDASVKPFLGFTSDIASSAHTPQRDRSSMQAAYMRSSPPQQDLPLPVPVAKAPSKLLGPRNIVDPPNLGNQESRAEESMSIVHVSRDDVLNAACRAGSKTSTRARNRVQAKQSAEEPGRATLKVAASTSRKKKTLLCQHQFTQGDRVEQQPIDGTATAHNLPSGRKPEKRGIATIIEERVKARLKEIDEKTRNPARRAVERMQSQEVNPDDGLDVFTIEDQRPNDDKTDQTCAETEETEIPADLYHGDQADVTDTFSTTINSDGHVELVMHDNLAQTATVSPSYQPVNGHLRFKSTRPKQEPIEPVSNVMSPPPKPRAPLRDRSGNLRNAAAGVKSKNNVSSSRMVVQPVSAALPAQESVRLPALSAPKLPTDEGPWSRDAFDLFVWRPPDWDEEKWCIKSST